MVKLSQSILTKRFFRSPPSPPSYLSAYRPHHVRGHLPRRQGQGLHPKLLAPCDGSVLPVLPASSVRARGLHLGDATLPQRRRVRPRRHPGDGLSRQRRSAGSPLPHRRRHGERKEGAARRLRSGQPKGREDVGLLRPSGCALCIPLVRRFFSFFLSFFLSFFP